MKHLSIKSYAKINISLNVLNKRKDGYHELDMVVLPVELHDTLIINKLKIGYDNFVTVDDFSIGNIQYNLATFAIDRLSSKYKINQKFRVFIHKVIPTEAGLGGGSSNAAFTLKAVNKMMKLNIGDDELIEIGKSLGADIPFFIKCEPARVTGIGEILEPIEVKKNYEVLIVKPVQGLSTKDVFEKCDSLEFKTSDIDMVIKALKDGDDDLLAKSINNSLEPAAISMVPEIQTVKDKLYELGFKIVQMSGSGTSVFALTTDRKLMKLAEKKLEDDYIVVRTKVLKKK